MDGATQIVGCARCRAPYRVEGVLFGRTHVVARWSDGKCDDIGTPPAIEVTRCVECGWCFWLRDAPLLAEIHPLDLDDSPDAPAVLWGHAPVVRQLDEFGHLDALADGLARSRGDEIFLRVRAWWSGNDAYRIGAAPWRAYADRPADVRANLEALHDRLDPDDAAEFLLKVESARQLERFDVASMLLADPAPTWHDAVATLTELVRCRVPEVVVLNRDESFLQRRHVTGA